MVDSYGLLIGIGAAIACGLMVLLWLVQVRIRDASHGDVGWAGGLAIVAVVFAVIGPGDVAHRVLVAVLGGLWGTRLALYLLLNRVIGKEEDGRYKTLREKWGPAANVKFFIFFQAQAGFVIAFSIPFALIVFDRSDGMGVLEWVGAALWVVAVSGEMLADWQLTQWRKNPANKGKTARIGLWNWSRHPNYFCEWLNWIAFALIALAAPHGWIALEAPLFLLFLLYKITGIPATEAQAVKSRPDYAQYQQEVSAFVPWFPKKAKRAGTGAGPAGGEA
jgi:steroid 5-alpha reductase family enzyme